MEKITVQGLIATTPRHIKTQDGLDITSFRLASSTRRYDHNQKRWIDSETNWYTVTMVKSLAVNVYASVNKGDRIIVQGNLRIRDWDNGSSSGTSVEIEADSLGHDLSWGNAVFTRTVLVSEKDEERGDADLRNELHETREQLKNLRDTLASLAEED
jgi:single-strand DNA-binding protein